MVIEALYIQQSTALERVRQRIDEVLATLGIAHPIDAVQITNAAKGGRYCPLGDPVVRINGECIPSDADGLPARDLLRYKIARAAGLKTILFVGKRNAIRSQMAEGIVTDLCKGSWAAFSAGIMPLEIPADVVSVMAEQSIDIGRQRAKHIDLFRDLTFDAVVMLCAEASSMGPPLPDYMERACLFFPDPLSFEMVSEGLQFSLRSAFRGLRNDIEKKLLQYIKEQDRESRR